MLFFPNRRGQFFSAGAMSPPWRRPCLVSILLDFAVWAVFAVFIPSALKKILRRTGIREFFSKDRNIFFIFVWVFTFELPRARKYCGRFKDGIWPNCVFCREMTRSNRKNGFWADVRPFVHFRFSALFSKPNKPAQWKLAVAFLRQGKSCYFIIKTIRPNLRLWQGLRRPNLDFLKIFSKTAWMIFFIFLCGGVRLY